MASNRDWKEELLEKAARAWKKRWKLLSAFSTDKRYCRQTAKGTGSEASAQDRVRLSCTCCSNGVSDGMFLLTHTGELVASRPRPRQRRSRNERAI